MPNSILNIEIVEDTLFAQLFTPISYWKILYKESKNIPLNIFIENYLYNHIEIENNHIYQFNSIKIDSNFNEAVGNYIEVVVRFKCIIKNVQSLKKLTLQSDIFTHKISNHITYIFLKKDNIKIPKAAPILLGAIKLAIVTNTIEPVILELNQDYTTKNNYYLFLIYIFGGIVIIVIIYFIVKNI